MITLYDLPLSGHAHRVRLLLSILNLPYTKVTVNMIEGEHKTESFLKLNPLGQVPVLKDDDLVLRDSTAMLVYLATKYDGHRCWLPEAPKLAAQIQQWLATSVKELALGPAVARSANVFGREVNYEEAVERSCRLLSSLYEPHLEVNSWLVGEHATIADLANYSYIAVADEGGLDMQSYPNIRAWLSRVEALEGFEAMPRAM